MMIDLALKSFKKQDPIMASLLQAALAKQPPLTLPAAALPKHYFRDLADIIVGQQLSTKAAATIWQRFTNLVGNDVTPRSVLKHSPDALRGVGLSNAKAKYILGMADDALSRRIKLNDLNELTDEAVVEQLIKLRGVGPWTAEMFLMFSLGRPDVFSYGDLGLRRSIERAYSLSSVNPASVQPLAEKWRPYRTVAALALWQSHDNLPLA